MSSFMETALECGGKRFKDMAVKLTFPKNVDEVLIPALTVKAEIEYGEENIIVHDSVVEENKVSVIQVLFFFKLPILEAANRIASPFGLTAEILGDVLSVGVGGDERSYTPVINIKGVFPGWDVIERISSEITNTLPINRVTFEPVFGKAKL